MLCYTLTTIATSGIGPMRSFILTDQYVWMCMRVLGGAGGGVGCVCVWGGGGGSHYYRNCAQGSALPFEGFDAFAEQPSHYPFGKSVDHCKLQD